MQKCPSDEILRLGKTCPLKISKTVNFSKTVKLKDIYIYQELVKLLKLDNHFSPLILKLQCNSYFIKKN